VEYADAHLEELVRRYQPDILWNDIGWPLELNGRLYHILADYFNTVPDGCINGALSSAKTSVPLCACAVQ
jgi:alpha-L-fucosidase